MQLGDSFKKIKFYNNYVEIGGSYSLIQAGRKLINAGYGDYIFFNLIPATIGGAVRQNAGTGQDEEIKDDDGKKNKWKKTRNAFNNQKFQ